MSKIPVSADFHLKRVPLRDDLRQGLAIHDRLAVCAVDGNHQVLETVDTGFQFGDQFRGIFRGLFAFLNQDHLLTSVEAEYKQFIQFYSIISEKLQLGLTGEEREAIARDRAYNMKNYIPYPGIREVLETLGKTHKLGVISDTWPSIVPQLEYLGVSQYFSFTTFSCSLGTVKPDKRMYLDALGKAGVPAGETVFIDDSVNNLEGAAALGITPILIAANPASDVDTVYLKIRDLRELIR